jgi:hypothetical protein
LDELIIMAVEWNGLRLSAGRVSQRRDGQQQT